MKTKQFTEKEVQKKIKKVLNKIKKRKLNGTVFPLTKVLGNYQFNSRNRYIKETLFKNMSQTYDGNKGGKWYLKYPDESSKKLAKRVMNTQLVLNK